MTLYELDYNLRQIDSLLTVAQDEESLDILEDAKKVLLQDIDEKAVDILTYMSDCTARAKHLKEEAIRLAKKAKALENRADWLKDLLKTHLQSTKQEKATYGIYDVSLAKTPDKVVLNNGEEQWLPDELCTITRTPNKTEIKKHMINGKLIANIDGQEIELAHLESDTTIRIK
ncbi:MAG: siphovirus Gp157 family protein [Methanobrevibacter sp.]|nr:siphovirus Gp157 family protein [Methanobrevibacter sp.]